MNDILVWWKLRQLKSKNLKARIHAIEKLGDLGDPQAIEPLIGSLFVKEEQAKAIDALVNIGSPAVESLVDRLITVEKLEGQKRQEMLGIIGEILRRIGDVQAIELLGKALEDKYTRHSALVGACYIRRCSSRRAACEST